VSALTLGTVASQLVLLAASAALARLFTPQEFGEFSVALAISTVIAVVATMGFEAAIPLAETDDEAAAIARLSLVCAASTALLVTVVLALGWAVEGSGWSRIDAGPGIWTIPPTAFAIAAWSSLRMVQSRAGRFTQVSIAGVGGSVVQSASQLGAGLLGGGAVWLALGYLAGRSANVVSLARRAALSWRSGTRNELYATARTWRRFPVYLAVPAVLNAVSVGAVAPAVALVYGLMFSGAFAFAARILAVPSALLGQAIATVFYPRAAAMERDGVDVASLMLRTATGLFMLAVPAFGTVLLLGPELFELIFGPQWREAGLIAAALAPWLAISFVSSPLSGYATIKNQLGRLLILSVVESALRLAALSVGVISTPILGVMAYSSVGLLICSCYIGWFLRLAGSSLHEWALSLRTYISVVLVAYPSCLLLKGHLPTSVYVAAAATLTLALLGSARRELGHSRGGAQGDGNAGSGRQAETSADYAGPEKRIRL